MTPPSCTGDNIAAANLPEPALLLVDGGQAVSVDGVEVVLVGDS